MFFSVTLYGLLINVTLWMQFDVRNCNLRCTLVFMTIDSRDFLHYHMGTMTNQKGAFIVLCHSAAIVTLCQTIASGN